MGVDSIIAAAAVDHPVVTRGDLVAAGLSVDQIKRAVQRGRLFRLYAGVFSLVVPGQLTVRTRLYAAQRAYGALATLDATSALVLWRAIDHFKPPVHLVLPSFRRTRDGFVLRRDSIEECDTTELHGIRVVTAARALVSAAGVLPPRDLEKALRQAEALEIVDDEAITSSLARAPRAPGRAALVALVADSARGLSRSTLEQELDRLIRESGLPLPERNAIVAGEEADFYYRGPRLVVEADHGKYHDGVVARRNDLNKRKAWRAAGEELLVLSAEEINAPGVAVALLGMKLGRLTALNGA